jgi:4-amino-4-deoxy-L-arabinose transferase-like glycosyltransferase
MASITTPGDSRSVLRGWLVRNWPAVALCGLLLVSLAQALRWVFLVPIYQSADEPGHLDYALAIRDHGGLFCLQHSSIAELPPLGHPYTAYLTERTWADDIRFDPCAKVSPEYGTPAFYAALDRDAPCVDPRQVYCARTATAYPFGYYALLAGWLGLIGRATDSVVATFFAARIFSVLLLAATLLSTYATTRELGFKPGFNLLLTGCMGLFPLTSFVSSYVQPDNLAFTLVSLSFFLSLRARRGGYAARWDLLLGLALGGLAVTKQHFWLCVTAAVLAMLATDLPWRRDLRRSLACLACTLLPSLVTGGIYLWTVLGTPNFHWRAARDASDPLYCFQGLKDAFVDFYSGCTHLSFWGVFGWLDAPMLIRRLSISIAVGQVVEMFTLLLLGLTLVRLAQIGWRLGRVAMRGRRRLALKAACSNPVLNTYFLFTLFMFFLFVRTGNRFGAQGRNWLPLLLPIFLAAIVYAPKAAALPWARRALSATVMAGLLLYTLVGAHYGIKTIQHRYYLPCRDVARTPVAVQPLEWHAMTWKNGAGDGRGQQSALDFVLPWTARAYGLQLRCVLTSPEPGPCLLRVSWRDADQPFREDQCNQVLRLNSKPGVRTVTLAIGSTAREVRIAPDVRPCHFELREMTLLHLPAEKADPGGNGQPGSGVASIAARPGDPLRSSPATN